MNEHVQVLFPLDQHFSTLATLRCGDFNSQSSPASFAAKMLLSSGVATDRHAPFPSSSGIRSLVAGGGGRIPMAPRPDRCRPLLRIKDFARGADHPRALRGPRANPAPSRNHTTKEAGAAGVPASPPLPVMATESPLETLQREITCSICLSYFKEPVSIDCGHNFCQSCIVQCWGHSDDENTSCPQCRRWSRKRSFRPNRELGNVVEVAKRLRLEAAASLAGQRLCEKHQEPLKLFCEEDETPVCVICRESRVHKAHPMLPIEEAAQDYKKKVAIHVKALKERREKLKESKEDLECRSQANQDDVQTEKQKVESAFNQIHEFLDKIEQFLIIMLRKFDKGIVQKRDEEATKLSEETDRIDALISEVEEKCQQPASEFLQDIRTILNRCKNGQLPQLVEASSSPTGLEKQLGHFSLKNVVIKEALEKCQVIMNSELAKAGSMETSAKKASITLDPSTAHPLCVVSEDKRSVKRGDVAQPLPNNPERFDATLILLGCEKFTSGIHYWEVEVGDGQNWALGVARESVERKGPVVCCPEQGIWALGLCGNEYKAFTSSETHLTLSDAPEKIQVFVHYERGWVAFFDADYMSLIFIFRSVKFYGEEIYPFFKVWGLNTELKMCQ